MTRADAVGNALITPRRHLRPGSCLRSQGARERPPPRSPAASSPTQRVVLLFSMFYKGPLPSVQDSAISIAPNAMSKAPISGPLDTSRLRSFKPSPLPP